MNIAERLAALEEIRSLKARYCRYIDTKQWKRLRSLFAPGAAFEGFSSASDGADADDFVHGVSGRLRDAVSVHHCHMPEIVLLDGDRARGVWAMQDHLEWPHPIKFGEAQEVHGFISFGHYEEEYCRIAGTWKFQFVRLTRLRLDWLPPGSIRDASHLRKCSEDWLSIGDP